MKHSSQDGHIHNVTNFEIMVNYCMQFGAKYSPSRVDIQFPQLVILRDEAFAQMRYVQAGLVDHNEIINRRALSFENIDKLSTRILNALEATELKQQTLDDAKGFVRQMRGKRAESITRIIVDHPLTEETEDKKKHSASQRGRVDLIQHFGSLILIASNSSLYSPNEEDLKVDALNARLKELQGANSAALYSETIMDTLRTARNVVLYSPQKGLVDISKSVKKYVLSVYGAKSDEYKRIKVLKFVNYDR